MDSPNMNKQTRKEFLSRCALGVGAAAFAAARADAIASDAPSPNSKPEAAPGRLSLAQTVDPGMTGLKGIAIDAEGRIYAAGETGIAILDADGKAAGLLETPQPVLCVAVAGDGSVYAGLRETILHFGSDGGLIRAFGRKGNAPGELRYVTGLAIVNGFLFVADAGARRLNRFAANGDFVDDIEGFRIPSPFFSCAAGPDGMLYAGHTGRHRIERYDGNMRLAGHFGQAGMGPADFCGCCNPTNVALFPNGNVAAAEKGIPRLKVYDSRGTLLAYLGPEHFAAGAAGMDLAIDSGGRVALADPVRGEIRFYELIV
ncbi:MAG: hypothetical protein BWZ10_02031 [candidate division BRC1 bacterium ADurb.BinA364]|nr:MAG: hypothetical protein BWZ10_02031 [candidate division BRC1 bacterium ADurb.BinA364]